MLSVSYPVPFRGSNLCALGRAGPPCSLAKPSESVCESLSCLNSQCYAFSKLLRTKSLFLLLSLPVIATGFFQWDIPCLCTECQSRTSRKCSKLLTEPQNEAILESTSSPILHAQIQARFSGHLFLHPKEDSEYKAPKSKHSLCYTNLLHYKNCK